MVGITLLETRDLVKRYSGRAVVNEVSVTIDQRSIVGLLGRYAAAGLFAVNVLAVVSYAHVLLAEGFEAALGQHYLWGFMLLVLTVVGPGRWAVDSVGAGRAVGMIPPCDFPRDHSPSA